MPKVTSHTPPWLCRPSPGASFFTGKPSAAVDKQAPKRVAYEGPQKTLAQRGTEVFALVDNQIRWSNLVTLKAESSSKPKSQKNETGKGAKQKKEFYRVCYFVLHLLNMR